MVLMTKRHISDKQEIKKKTPHAWTWQERKKDPCKKVGRTGDRDMQGSGVRCVCGGWFCRVHDGALSDSQSVWVGPFTWNELSDIVAAREAC